MTAPTRTQLISYGALALPVAFAGLPLYVLVPDFYAAQHAVSLSLLGVILLGLRAFDAVQDPLIGTLSDRFPRQRYAVMLIAAMLATVGIYFLFHPPAQHAPWWFAGWMLLTVTAYSVLSINLNTLGALWSADHHQRTRITTTREAFGLVGLLMAVILPATLAAFLAPTQVFLWYSLILALCMGAGMLCLRQWISQQPAIHSPTAPSLRKSWQMLTMLPKQTRYFFAIYGVSVLASSIPAVLVLFFIRDRLHAEAYAGLFLLLYFLSGALFMPLWQLLSRRYGKAQAWLLATLLAVASFMWAFFLEAGDIWAYGVICITSGAALGADLALPPSMLADEMSQHRTHASAATQFSLLSLLAKLGLAVGSAAVLPLLDSAGFQPAAANSDAALHRLSVVYALLPCAIKLLAAGLLFHFIHRLTKDVSHETNLSHPASGSSLHVN